MSLETGKRPPESEHLPCVFCDIKDGKSAVSKINETEKSLSFIALEGHVLVVPRAHITRENIHEHAEEIGETYAHAVSILPAVEKAFGATGINMVMNLGASAGQEMSHVHVHLIDRKENDGKLKINSMPKLQRAELDIRATRVRANLNNI